MISEDLKSKIFWESCPQTSLASRFAYYEENPFKFFCATPHPCRTPQFWSCLSVAPLQNCFCLTPQVNGNLTLGENIADNGGIKSSYQAFLRLMNTTEQPMLPALKYTPEQLYFIAYGQVCIVHFYTSVI